MKLSIELSAYCSCWPVLLITIVHGIPLTTRPDVQDEPQAESLSSSLDFSKVCEYESGVYTEGQNFTTSNPCETCVCHPPGFSCTLLSCDVNPGCRAIHTASECCPEYLCDCEKNGKVYLNGEKVEDETNGNPCEVCFCRGGVVECVVVNCYTRDDCEPKYTPGRCCPKYDHCPPTGATKANSTSLRPGNELVPTTTAFKEETSTTSVPPVVATLAVIEIHPGITTTTPRVHLMEAEIILRHEPSSTTEPTTQEYELSSTTEPTTQEYEQSSTIVIERTEPSSTTVTERRETSSTTVTERTEPSSTTVTERRETSSTTVTERTEPCSTTDTERTEPSSTTVSERTEPSSTLLTEGTEPIPTTETIVEDIEANSTTITEETKLSSLTKVTTEIEEPSSSTESGLLDPSSTTTESYHETTKNTSKDTSIPNNIPLEQEIKNITLLDSNELSLARFQNETNDESDIPSTFETPFAQNPTYSSMEVENNLDLNDTVTEFNYEVDNMTSEDYELMTTVSDLAATTWHNIKSELKEDRDIVNDVASDVSLSSTEVEPSVEVENQTEEAVVSGSANMTEGDSLQETTTAQDILLEGFKTNVEENENQNGKTTENGDETTTEAIHVEFTGGVQIEEVEDEYETSENPKKEPTTMDSEGRFLKSVTPEKMVTEASVNIEMTESSEYEATKSPRFRSLEPEDTLDTESVSNEAEVGLKTDFPPILLINSDQLKFLQLGKEQPLYVSTGDSDMSESKEESAVVVSPTTPLTVEMVKVVGAPPAQPVSA